MQATCNYFALMLAIYLIFACEIKINSNMESEIIKLLLADDHHLFRTGIVGIISNVNDFRLLGEATDGDDLIEKYFQLTPDVVIADIAMPNVSGFDAYREIKKIDPRCKFLFLSMYESPEYIHYTLKIGGKGLIGKNVNQQELIYAIRQIAKGKQYFGEEWPEEKLKSLDKKYKNLADGKIDPNIVLTPKEKEILYFISEGYTSSEIAEKINVSKRTVDTHRVNLMKKTKSNSPSQLIAFAIKFTSVTDFKVNEEEEN